MKKYIIDENQYNQLLKIKRNKKITDEILSKVDRANKSLNESIIINEAVKDIIGSYIKKGLINNSIKEMIIKSGKINESIVNCIKL